ncbi:MAG: hypothetical protein ACJA1A_002344, partial [Saprospiraceae bacterium]
FVNFFVVVFNHHPLLAKKLTLNKITTMNTFATFFP